MTLQGNEWVEAYPPMIISSSYPAVVSTSDGRYLFVVGRNDSNGEWTSTVQLFQVETRSWCTTTNLPRPLPCPSATILCGSQLIITDQHTDGLSCSLQSLPSSDQPISSPLSLSWKPLPTLPVRLAAPTTLCGQLVIVGVDSIYQLLDEQWILVGCMTSSRWMSLVVSESPYKIIVVGGWDENSKLSTVEHCIGTF